MFLDRDGVINRPTVRNGKPYPPISLSDLVILPGVETALKRLHGVGFKLVVVTNQPDVARGTQSRANVEEIHAALRKYLTLDEIRVCYHDDIDRCTCRKPAPGMILDAAHDSEIDLGASYMVGDRWRDIEAGRRAGTRTILIDYVYNETRVSEADMVVKSLAEATDWIISQQNGGHR